MKNTDKADIASKSIIQIMIQLYKNNFQIACKSMIEIAMFGFLQTELAECLKKNIQNTPELA